MNTIHAIILGAIQGLTEFLPISSSAHLEAVPWFLGWKTPGLTFDVALHVGTLFALLAYFWREWYDMIRAYVGSKKLNRSDYESQFTSEQRSDASLIWPIIIACIPAGIAGVLFENLITLKFRNHPVFIAIPLMALGILLLVADRIGRKSKPMDQITLKDCLIIGIAQAFALIPGVSRSGITITAGLFCGLKRDAAARFSFFLGAPIILAAAAYKLLGVAKHGLPSDQIAAFAMGIISATVVGYLCIGFLMDYLKKRRMDVFVIYRFVFSACIVAAYVLKS